MTKFCTFVLFLIMLVLASEESMVVMIEAKNCEATWKCEGGDKCREDCKSRYNGIGLCDLYTPPIVPKQCFCRYPC
ncbi:hypothetical protein HS088_TW11G00622 [Tripterygium wilfordii]|uniref:Uncharacterized protein n=1 Tax=Tripterygium wilfordii TaxID=458696 RepID=A0A7J7D2I5_TRIWF|nr:hypothetical protein HS088_TW11G00622 [Tripterygium wilfordii]